MNKVPFKNLITNKTAYQLRGKHNESKRKSDSRLISMGWDIANAKYHYDSSTKVYDIV